MLRKNAEQHLPLPSLSCMQTAKGPENQQQSFATDSSTLSNTFMMAEVRSTGRKSFVAFTVVFFGTGIMQEVFHIAGTGH